MKMKVVKMKAVLTVLRRIALAAKGQKVHKKVMELATLIKAMELPTLVPVRELLPPIVAVKELPPILIKVKELLPTIVPVRIPATHLRVMQLATLIKLTNQVASTV